MKASWKVIAETFPNDEVIKGTVSAAFTSYARPVVQQLLNAECWVLKDQLEVEDKSLLDRLDDGTTTIDDLMGIIEMIAHA